MTKLTLGMVLHATAYSEKTIVVTTTHTLVLEADQTIGEIHPEKPHLIGHGVSFDACF